MKENQEKRKYTVTEKAKQAHEKQNKSITGINATYWEDFTQSGIVSQSSLAQYKSGIRRFAEYVQKDLLTVTVTDIKSYLDTFEAGSKTQLTQQRYIKSFLKYTFTNNVDAAIERTVTDTIMWLLDEDVKGLLKILMSK